MVLDWFRNGLGLGFRQTRFGLVYWLRTGCGLALGRFGTGLRALVLDTNWFWTSLLASFKTGSVSNWFMDLVSDWFQTGLELLYDWMTKLLDLNQDWFRPWF